MSTLSTGDLLPAMVTSPPGPLSRRLAADLAICEAPVVNTVVEGAASIVWQQALGSNVVDVDGNRYIDLSAGFGVANVGHRHRRVVDAIKKQSDSLLHGLGDVHPHPLRARLASRLRDLAPMEDAQVYPAASGADAVEIALKTATLASGRSAILAFDPAYHGTTLGALSVTSRAAFREPFEEQLRTSVLRLPYGCPSADIEGLLANRPEVGAVIFEPILGREGVILPPDGWLEALAQACRRHDVLTIADEIFTGFHRTGPLFATSDAAVTPDILCCGKALGGGLPIAAVLASRETFRHWDRGPEAIHTATFIAHPLACAAADAVLDILVDEDLGRRARRSGEIVAERTSDWTTLGVVVEVRGRGLLWGIELRSAAAAKATATTALSAGVLLLAGGKDGRVLQVSPPLNIAPRQLEEALRILRNVLEQLDAVT